LKNSRTQFRTLHIGAVYPIIHFVLSTVREYVALTAQNEPLGEETRKKQYISEPSQYTKLLACDSNVCISRKMET